MFKCTSCGKIKIFQSPRKYNLCQECNQILRNEVTEQIDKIKDIVTQSGNYPTSMEQYKDFVKKIDTGLHIIEQLETARPKYPFFKSSLETYINQLNENKENCFNILKQEEERKEQEEKERKLQEQKIFKAHREAEALLKKYGPTKNIFSIVLFDDSYKSYSYKEVEVVASELISDRPLTEELSAGDTVTFQKEPDNQYDENAILVFHQSGPIGYLKRGTIQSMVNDWIDENKSVVAKIHSINPYEYKIFIDMAFYTNLFLKYQNKKYLDCKLIRTSKENEYESRQDHLRFAKKGEELNIESKYDYDKDETRYIVSSSEWGELGELSKKDTQKFMKLEEEEDLIPVLLKVTTNENFVYGAVIRIYIL